VASPIPLSRTGAKGKANYKQLFKLAAGAAEWEWKRQNNRAAVRDFFVNVTRYPRYLIALGLGVGNSVLAPLLARTSNPVTAIALVAAAVSGSISLALVLHAMVTPLPGA
jgi:hypothetical protein